MTVLHVLPNVSRSFGGPTQSLIGYARSAASTGIDVGVAAPQPPSGDAAWLQKQVPEATFHFFEAVGTHTLVTSPKLWAWLLSHEASRAYDIIHIHGLFNLLSSVSSWICCLQDRSFLIRPFGTLSRYTFSRRWMLKQLYFQLIDRPVLRRASTIHFTTEAEKEEASRLAIDLDGRAHVVPPPLLRNGASVAERSPADRPTVLFLSRLHPKKNVLGLLNAWRRVVDECPEAQLWIAGDGADEYVTELKAQVRRLELKDQVSFLGFVRGAEKERVLREAWAFALPSHQENLGVAVLEAIAAGLPVVISPDVQVKSFVEDYDFGHVVPRDASMLANALTLVLENESMQRRVADQGPDAIEESFSTDVVGEQLAEMYSAAV